MDYSEYLKEPNAKVPEDIAEKISRSGNITPLRLDEMNSLLTRKDLRQEAGYVQLSDGNYLAAMYCPMPGVTAEMIEWWFWWHPQERARYRLWFPGEHFDISYAAKDKKYFSSAAFPGFQENTQYPVERVGKDKAPLSIEFVKPERFGFDRQSMDENGVAAIVCGHVGILKGLVPHTEMAHIFFRTDCGLFLVSRFWMGTSCRSKLLRRKVASEASARGMAEHCCIEYRNLARKLPSLYEQFAVMEDNRNGKEKHTF